MPWGGAATSGECAVVGGVAAVDWVGGGDRRRQWLPRLHFASRALLGVAVDYSGVIRGGAWGGSIEGEFGNTDEVVAGRLGSI